MRDTAFKRDLKELPLGTVLKFEAPGGSFTLHGYLAFHFQLIMRTRFAILALAKKNQLRIALSLKKTEAIITSMHIHIIGMLCKVFIY